MRTWLVILLLGGACKGSPKVDLSASSCGDVAACSAECDRGIVVACDRGGDFATDRAAKMDLYRRGLRLWAEACDIGNPEACMRGAHDAIRARGGDPSGLTPQQMARDPDACEYVEIWARGEGRPLAEPCP